MNPLRNYKQEKHSDIFNGKINQLTESDNIPKTSVEFRNICELTKSELLDSLKKLGK